MTSPESVAATQLLATSATNDTGRRCHNASGLRPYDVDVAIVRRWIPEPGSRVGGARPPGAAKVQAPGAVVLPAGGVRLFYTGVGPGRPYREAQGYILSALSADGISFQVEDGIRVGPDPAIPWLSRRALAPTVTRLCDGRWRMYFEARGTADR